MSRTRLVSVVLFVAVVLAFARQSAALNPDVPKPKDQPPPKRVPLKSGHELMVAKLKESQTLLEGITLGDFPKVEKSAIALGRIAQAAEFLNAGKSKEYELQINLFRRATETINRKAKDRNFEGVVLGFQDMTMTCVKCHQHTRDGQPDARLPRLPSVSGR